MVIDHNSHGHHASTAQLLTVMHGDFCIKVKNSVTLYATTSTSRVTHDYGMHGYNNYVKPMIPLGTDIMDLILHALY